MDRLLDGYAIDVEYSGLNLMKQLNLHVLPVFIADFFAAKRRLIQYRAHHVHRKRFSI